MEQAATIREVSALAQRVSTVETFDKRLSDLEKAVQDINKTAFKILLALCGHALLLLVAIVLYATGVLKHVL